VRWSVASATNPPGLRICARSGGLAEKCTRPRPVNGYEHQTDLSTCDDSACTFGQDVRVELS
jgi:hypothetical protein